MTTLSRSGPWFRPAGRLLGLLQALWPREDPTDRVQSPRSGDSLGSSVGAQGAEQNHSPRPRDPEQEIMRAFQGVPSAHVAPVLILVVAYLASRQGCVHFVGPAPKPALGTADKAVVENLPPLFLL